MKVAIACGGTGGHVYPGLATAEVLVSRGHDVTILGTGRDVESAALAGWNGNVIDIGLAMYNRSNIAQKLLHLFRARKTCVVALKEIRAEALLAMGGYASIAPVFAASRLGIPSVLHEGNAVPGKALKFLINRAAAVAVNFESTAGILPVDDVTPIGFPVRAELIEQAKAPRRGNEVMTLLVVGGSQGAEFLNDVIPQVVRKMEASASKLKVLHIAGDAHLEKVRNSYKGVKADAEVMGFVNHMAELYSSADMAISRAGASVCAELAVFGIPSLLVPLPAAKDDHQTANARHYSSGGGAQLISQEEFSVDYGVEFINSLLASAQKQKMMSDRMLACARINAAADLACIVESLTG